MTRARGPAPTRYNLLRSRRRLQRVRKGAELLGRKRRALVEELFRLARPAADAREKVARQAEAAYPLLLEALAVRGGAELAAQGRDREAPRVEIRTRVSWGVPAAEIVEAPAIRRSPPARGASPSLTGPATEEAVGAFGTLVDLLLETASREIVLRRLGEALSRTARQLNTLEERVAPRLEEDVERIERVLEEREREEKVRVKHLLRGRGAGGPGGPRRSHPGRRRRTADRGRTPS